MVKLPITARIDEALIARLEAWLEKQTVPPKRSAVIEAALAKWLDEQEAPDDPPTQRSQRSRKRGK